MPSPLVGWHGVGASNYPALRQIGCCGGGSFVSVFGVSAVAVCVQYKCCRRLCRVEHRLRNSSLVLIAKAFALCNFALGMCFALCGFLCFDVALHSRLFHCDCVDFVVLILVGANVYA